MSSTPAFAPVSTFTPRLRNHPRSVSRHANKPPPVMSSPQNAKRIQEIEKLQRQLEELRAQREARASAQLSTSAATPSAPPPPPTPAAPVQNSLAPINQEAAFTVGKHAQGNKFLTISKVESEEYFPRILTVAGRIGDLTVEKFLSTPPVLQNRSPDAGNMFLTMLPEGYEDQIIAMPGLEALGVCKDPVAVLVGGDTLSATSLPIADGDDVVLVVERNLEDIKFRSNRFYLWAVGDVCKVGWSKDMPVEGEARMIGSVIHGMIEVRTDLRQRRSCWEEENEAYMA